MNTVSLVGLGRMFYISTILLRKVRSEATWSQVLLDLVLQAKCESVIVLTLAFYICFCDRMTRLQAVFAFSADVFVILKARQELLLDLGLTVISVLHAATCHKLAACRRGPICCLRVLAT